MKTTINPKEIEKFLKDANKNTYANTDAPKATPSRLNSEDYHFEKNDLIYHDTYFGGRDFIGGEVIYKNEIPVWGMNYYGYVLDESVSEKEVYIFLRKALMKEYDDILPIRGPKEFQEVNKKYVNKPIGELDRFTGKEEIMFDGKVVYRADYHGGFIC